MKHTDFLIIGQGIAGTLLSFELLNAGKSVIVVDKPNPLKASLVAGAVLNPMAGKHWSPSPLVNLFLPKGKEVYRQLEHLLNVSILKEMEFHLFHESEEKRLHFEQQQRLFPEYLSDISNETSAFFNAPNGQGKINGVSTTNAETLLLAMKQFLMARDSFIEDDFKENLLELKEGGVQYKNLKASKIIYCNGIAATNSRFFNSLPFTKNRGDVLMLDIPELPEDTVYHQKLRLVPKGNHQFWCGSNYQWDFENLLPDENWRKESEATLKYWLKIPFEIKNHIVAQRPTSAGQIPFIGIHPKYESVGIFNGLGTRGFSSGPYWANAFAKRLIDPGFQIPGYNSTLFEKWL